MEEQEKYGRIMKNIKHEKYSVDIHFTNGFHLSETAKVRGCWVLGVGESWESGQGGSVGGSSKG